MILTLQNRLKTLLSADGYFTGAPIITEEVGDIANAIEIALGKMSFCVVVMNGSGERSIEMGKPSLFNETFTISIAQNPITDLESATRNVVDGIEHAILAIDNQVADVGKGPHRFRVLSHQAGRSDDGLAVQELTVRVAGIIYLEAPVG